MGATEDTEENKLEHTTIFNDYVCILEEIIEANLKENFTEEEIEAFFKIYYDCLDAQRMKMLGPPNAS